MVKTGGEEVFDIDTSAGEFAIGLA